MKTINDKMNEKRTMLYAFTNGSYKKITSVAYDHKEWIVVTKESGKQVYINTDKLKWIEEL